MDDLDALATLDLFVWLLPLAGAMGLSLAALYRAVSTAGEARTYAFAAAIFLGLFTVSVLFWPVGFVGLAILGILGLGTWVAAVITAPKSLLWTEVVIVPVAVVFVWMFL